MQSTFKFKQSTTTGIWLVPESNNVRSLSLDFGHLCQNPVSPYSGDQNGRILAIWLAGFQPF
jgi:hypothetical protein